MLCECFYGLKCELPLLDLVLILQSLRSELLKYGSCCISFVWQVEALFDAVRHAVAKCPKEMTDLPGSAIHLYEVLYIGKVVVSTKKAPPSFIDDAVAKFDEVARQVEKNLSVLYMLTSVYEIGMCGNRISVRFRFIKTRTEPNRSQKVKSEISVSAVFLKTEFVSYI